MYHQKKNVTFFFQMIRKFMELEDLCIQDISFNRELKLSLLLVKNQLIKNT